MKNTLEDIREKLKEKFYLNEEHIRFSLVGRILFELGWDIWNPKEVYTEFPVARTEDNTKVDIALCLRTNLPSVFIEIKGHTKIEQIQLIEKQLRDYNRNLTATFTIITDGQQWRFYYSLTPGEFSDKCYRTVDLLKDDLQQIEDEFISLLSKDKIDNGEAESVAKKYVEFSAKERVIKDSLSEANKLIDNDPLLNKVQAIQRCVKDKGYTVSENEVLAFLQKNSNTEINSNKSPQIHPIKSERLHVLPRNENFPKAKEFVRETSVQRKGIYKKNEHGTVLQVSLNGHIFRENKAIDTFISVIKFFGVERVETYVNIGSSYPLVIRKNGLRNYEDGKYTSIDGQYYVYSNNNTASKKKYLETIAEQLKEKIKVEIISKFEL